MKIALIDDQKNDVLELHENLKRYAGEQNLDFDIHCFSSAQGFLSKYRHDYEFIIFDIDMPGMNGMDAAKKLREFDSDVAIMFVTNMPQYALEGYSVEAVDYILKPIAYPDFCLKMQRALRYIERNQDHTVHIHSSDGIRTLKLSDIYYIESQLHYLIYHTKEGVFRTRSTLNETEKNIGCHHFARASTSFLINLKYVKSLTGDDLLVENTHIKISRGKKSSFLAAFTRYVGGITS